MSRRLPLGNLMAKRNRTVGVRLMEDERSRLIAAVERARKSDSEVDLSALMRRLLTLLSDDALQRVLVSEPGARPTSKGRKLEVDVDLLFDAVEALDKLKTALVRSIAEGGGAVSGKEKEGIKRMKG